MFEQCYLNEAAVAEARNPSYPGWAAAGHIVVTAGNETDFDEIEADVRRLCSRFNVERGIRPLAVGANVAAAT